MPKFNLSPVEAKKLSDFFLAIPFPEGQRHDLGFYEMLFTMFMSAGMAITFLGAFFRGPGYAWTMPWDGFFFAL